MFQEIFKPMTDKISEVQKLYDDSKNAAMDAAKALTEIKTYKKFNEDDRRVKEKSKKFGKDYGQFMNQQNVVRDEFNKVDDELARFKEEKMAEMENCDIDLMSRHIMKLKKMLTDMEDKAHKGQTELENKINQVNKRYN